MSYKPTGWKDFYKLKFAELKKDNPKLSVQQAMPQIKEMWKDYKKETEFDIEVPDEPVEEETKMPEKIESKSVEKAPEEAEEFKYQCESCSYLFNEKISKCPKCGVDFVW